MGLIQKYITPLFVVLGPYAFVVQGKPLVGLLLLTLGVAATLNLFAKWKWANTKTAIRVQLSLWGLGLALLVIIVVRRMMGLPDL